MEAPVWAVIGILGGVLAVLLAFLFTSVRGLDARIDGLGRGLNGRIDSLGDKIDRLASELRTEIRALGTRLEAHLERHET
jgi:hypothetical protein